MRFTLILSTLLLFGLTCQALADEKGEILFADDFATLDPGWGEPDDEFLGAHNKKLIFEPAQARTEYRLHEGHKFEDADIRVKVTQASGEPPRGAGVAFWCDKFRGYVATLESNGDFRVVKITGTPLSPAVKQTPAEAVKKGLNQVNQLRVVTKGKTATIYVNGQQVASFKGSPPEGGGRVGLYATSGAVPCRWEFSDFVVRKPE